MVKFSALSKKLSIINKKNNTNKSDRKRKVNQQPSKDITTNTNLKQLTVSNESISNSSSDDNLPPITTTTVTSIKTSKVKETNNNPSKIHRPNEITQHKQQLESLKEIDPDFYNFLRDQDESLLNFKNEVSSDLSDGEEIDDLSDGLNDSFSSDVGESDDDSKEEDNEPNNQLKSVEIFEQTVDKLFEDSKQKNIVSIKMLMKCFHSIVYDQFCEDLSKPSIKSLLDHNEHQIYHKYRIQAVYANKNSINRIINFCLKHISSILSEILNEKSKKSATLKIPLKLYFIDQYIMLNCLSNSSESLISIVSSIHTTSKFLGRYPKILHSYINIFVRMLEYHDEDVRISCFELLRKWSQTKKSDSIYQQIDKVYLSNNGFSKYHDAYSSLWLFLKVSICELLSVIPQNAYQILFKRCKKMIIDLQNAIVTNDKKSTIKIYSWQFIHSAELITFAICNDPNPESLLKSNLIHPITQIMMATLNATNSPKFIPFKLHIIKCLTKLVTETNFYIPLSLHFINILEHKELLVVGSNVVSANTKQPVLCRMIKVSKDQALLNQYKAAVFNTIVEHFLQYIITFSNNVAFPDLIFLPTKWLKKVLKDTKVKRQSLILKIIVQKMEENARKISDIRFTMDEGSSIFDPIKPNDTVNMSTTANTSASNLMLPNDQNSIVSYLIRLKENNFDEAILKPAANAKSHSTPNGNAGKKEGKKNKLTNTLRRIPSKLKAVASLTKTNGGAFKDVVVDLDLSD